MTNNKCFLAENNDNAKNNEQERLGRDEKALISLFVLKLFKTHGILYI
jgi:hypothetical protein